MIARPGQVVAWWDGDTLAVGLVAAEEKRRLRLVRARGKDDRVKPERVAVVVADDVPVPGVDPTEHRQAAEQVGRIEARLRERAATVEVDVLWEILHEAGGATQDRPRPIRELAELALDSSAGEACAAVMVALVEDGVHFVRKADGWCPRKREAVEALRVERERVSRRQRETREFLEGLRLAVRSGTFDARNTDVERRYLDALERMAIEGGDVDDTFRGPALEALEASSIGWVRPHEGAFHLLRRLGRFASDDANLQVPRFGLRTTFPEEVLVLAREREAAGFDRSGRRDLTGLGGVSIDGPYTREIDDVLTVEPRSGGGYRLGIHIADPSAFVVPDDDVDREALSRGLTHYMPDLRLPMLPPPISERAASLVAGQDRPALSFLVDLDEAGEIVTFDIGPSVVHAERRLTYELADQGIAEGDRELAALAECGRCRLAVRGRAGAVAIRAPEVDIHLDEAGAPALERMPPDSPSRLAVSEAMVLAGELAARFCIKAGFPAIYRRQAPPAQPIELPAEGLQDPVAVRRARRAMRRAETALEPGAHAGLGLEAYAQASSPLRRYQDLVNHRQIVACLRGERACYERTDLLRIAATTERAEVDARRAEDAAGEYWILRYLERFVGQSIDATIVESDPHAIVQLDETLREQPVRGLAGLEPGSRVRLTVVRVVPRAGLLSLRPVD